MSKGLFELFGSNISVQILSIIATPFITRLFNPGDVGLAQLILAVALVASPFIDLSLNQAIIKSQGRIARVKIFQIGFKIILLNSLIVTSIMLAIEKILLNNLHNIEVHYFAIFFLIILSNALTNFLQSVNLSKRNYTRYSYSVLLNSVVANTIKISVGTFFPTATSLLSGILAGFFSIFIFNARNFLLKKFPQKIELIKILKTVKDNKKYTLYQTLTSAIGIFINWQIIILAPQFANINQVGLVSLAMIIINTISFPFVQSMYNYYMSELASGIHGKEYLIKMSIAICLLGFFISSAMTLILYFFGDYLVKIIFGLGWNGVAQYAVFLSLAALPMFAFYPIYAAISNIKNHQKSIFNVDLFIIFISIASVLYCKYYDLEFLIFLQIICCINFFSHCIKFLTILILEKITK
jgi:O-antigen/teichoic acid export membrane protein